MHDEPRDPAMPLGDPVRPGATGDPGDLTQRHPTPPAPAPVEPVTPATTEIPAWPSQTRVEPDGAQQAASFTPSPEPRADWARSWSETPPVTPERWYEPAPVAPPTVAVVPTARTGRRSGPIFAAALLSAVLASAGTVLALGAVGALDRSTPAAGSGPQATNVGSVQPVAIDESSATIAVAAKVSPAVVRITVTGSTDAGNLGVIPTRASDPA